jgi:NAD(P)-dependent dehydrogenase (short-subunit alcohol dehydrogenase family)
MSGTRIALVTGANKGLGFETSRQLSQQDIKVLMGSRSITRGRKAVRSLLEEALDVEIIHLDVTKTDHIRQAAKYIKEKYGRLDILINNAGMVHAEESHRQQC